MRAKILLVLPLVLVILTSGCTLPAGLCIPGFSCAEVHEQEPDVYVISSIKALPDEISPGQSTRIMILVENKATAPFDEVKYGEISKDVTVELYDYCEGMLEVTEATKGDCTGSKCTIKSLLPGEKREIFWTLKANDDTKLESSCNLKVRAAYQYTTGSVISVHLVDYAEMQRELNEGTFKEESSMYSDSYGPLKPHLSVEDTQPIAIQSGETKVSTVFGFQVKNRGSGFLTTCDGSAEGGSPGIASGSITVTSSGSGTDIGSLIKAEIDKLSNKKLTMIGKETPKIILPVGEWDVGNVPIKTTKVIEVVLKNYCYEFREDLDIKVMPKT